MIVGDIYMIRNKLNNKMYVGQTIFDAEKRYKQHIDMALHKKDNKELYNSMRKHGVENFELIILETGVSVEQLDEREVYYIEKFDTYNNGYNYTKGGGGIRGYHHSEETRRKMGIAISNSMWKINTPERTAKISATQKGRKFTEEHKRHIAESVHDREGAGNPFYGKKHTDETKQKISDKNTRYDVIQSDASGILNVFDSVRDAACYCIETGLTSAKLSSAMYRIYTTCIGNQKQCYGFFWKYKEKCID